MTKYDTPRDAEGRKLCAWCGSEVTQPATGRSRDYCRRSCRQRAYEARKQREAVVAAVAAAVARTVSSRDGRPSPTDASRDETESSQVAAPSSVERGDFLIAPPAPSTQQPALPVRPSMPLPDPAVPRGKKRRSILPPFPRRSSSQPVLFEESSPPESG
jgi:type IV secretory pathway VirB10-like protein